MDETFYLLVGDAMHHGAAPYVDIWDRKPPGLFAFFWLLAGISTSVLTFQIAAVIFTAATAYLIHLIALRWADRTGAALAGLTYIAWLQPLLGGGGQSPVYYNLFVVGAVALLVRGLDDLPVGIRHRHAIGAALLCGIAVSFKPTALFEGAFVVLAFAWREWSRTRSASSTLHLFVPMAVAASLPTVLAMAWYIAHGQFEAYWQATVISNFHKGRSVAAVWAHTVRFLLLLSLPLTACALLGQVRARQEQGCSPFALLIRGWLMAALAGFLAVPNFYSHYALPLVPVLAVAAAPWFAHGLVGRVVAVVSMIWALHYGQSFDFDKATQSAARFERVTQVLRANMPHGTLYIHDGTPWLYHTTQARLPGRFVFPEHLAMSNEAPAIGVDPVAELARVLAQAPDAIVVTDTLRPEYNRTTFAMLQREVTARYTLVCALPGADFEHSFTFYIYALNQAPDRRQCPSAAARSGKVLPKPWPA
ncbi:ArnT family glycosyltransferase [Novosphingobium cyanobacteriorum]|uniref:ArnT family glycosyltransferase n=1 Tax=Novosphingobium cyanobacteriorum TaxID=3024215 RepID=UPI0023F6D3F9|nr:hypothetical protein [Novosphingobium cyanobacteriorum]